MQRLSLSLIATVVLLQFAIHNPAGMFVEATAGSSKFVHRPASTPRGGGKPNHTIDSVGKNSNPVQTFVLTIKDARRHLTAAAVARCVSIFGMYPIDTIKVRTTKLREISRTLFLAW